MTGFDEAPWQPPVYERLTVPGLDVPPAWTKVEVGIKFRFVGRHSNAAAVAEAESRLALVQGPAEIMGMTVDHPIMTPEIGDAEIVDPPEPALPGTTAEYARRIVAALDAIGQLHLAGDVHHKDKIIDDAVRALTGDGTPASTYQQWTGSHPGWAGRMMTDD